MLLSMPSTSREHSGFEFIPFLLYVRHLFRYASPKIDDLGEAGSLDGIEAIVGRREAKMFPL